MANPNPERHLENLKPFKSGASGNPAGSSKRARLRAAIIRLLDEKDLDATFAKAGMDEALKGAFAFWREILNRVDGPVEPAMATAKYEAHIQARAQTAEDEQARQTDRAESIELGVSVLLAADLAITRPMAERYIRELVPLLEVQRRNVALIRGANPMAPLATSPAEMEEELIRRTWKELAMPGDPDSLCRLDGPGDRKLPPPAALPPTPAGGPPPDVDQAFLAARAVDDERERRERVKHPMRPSPPSPAGGPGPEPPPPIERESDEYIAMRAAMWNSERERRR